MAYLSDEMAWTMLEAYRQSAEVVKTLKLSFCRASLIHRGLIAVTVQHTVHCRVLLLPTAAVLSVSIGIERSWVRVLPAQAVDDDELLGTRMETRSASSLQTAPQHFDTYNQFPPITC